MINFHENFRPVKENSSDAVVPTTIMPMEAESLFQIIWRGRWLALLTTILALSAAFIYLLKATPTYTSTSRIYVEQSGPRIISDLEEGVMTGSKNYLYTQAELLKSTPILAAALEIPNVGQMKTFAKVDNKIVYLKKNLQAQVGKKDDIISLSFDSPFPAEAAQLVNAVVDCYVTYHATRKRSTAAEVLKILQSEKTKRSKELSEKLKALMDYKRENLALAFDDLNSNVILQRLVKLSEAMTEAELLTIGAKSTYESTKAMVTDPAKLNQFIQAQRSKGVYISTGGEQDSIRSKLDELQDRRRDRLQQLTPDHPGITVMDAEISQLKERLTKLDEQFAQAQLAVAEQQYLAAKENEEQFASRFKEQRREAIVLNDQLSQYALLQSEWEQTKKLCDIIDDRIKELNVTEDVGALNISILEVARPAEIPSEPQKARIMGIALILGLMLGGGLAFVRDWLDQTLRSSEEISNLLGLPVLGVIPAMSRRLSPSLRGQRVRLEPTSYETEAFRTIRTALFFGAPKEETKTILVTSSAPEDGKSTLVSNLGITMAQAGQKTLIIDADFRKPMQNVIFEVNHHDKCLSSVLAGKIKFTEAIQSTQVRGLELLGCEPGMLNPTELLNSKAFARLLKYLSERYDRVIVDSPPIGPVTDAEILGALCNITILVLRADKSTRKQSQRARDRLQSVGAHILGTVVNGVYRKHGRYGYYSSYQYYHGYYSTDRQQNKNRKTEVTEPIMASRDQQREPLSRIETSR